MTWNATTCLSKLSVLFLYVDLIPVQRLVTIARGLGLFIILWNVANTVVPLAMCRPFAFAWNTSIPGGSCGGWVTYYKCLGIFNVLIDVFILLLPMPFLLKLQMPLHRRLVLVGIFSIGWM
jgi:hypothetical protein